MVNKLKNATVPEKYRHLFEFEIRRDGQPALITHFDDLEFAYPLADSDVCRLLDPGCPVATLAFLDARVIIGVLGMELSNVTESTDYEGDDALRAGIEYRLRNG